MREVAQELAERRKDVPLVDKITWYYRHWVESGDKAKEGVKNKHLLPSSYIDNAEWNDWMSNDPRNPQSKAAKEAKEQAKKDAKEQKKLEKE